MRVRFPLRLLIHSRGSSNLAQPFPSRPLRSFELFNYWWGTLFFLSVNDDQVTSLAYYLHEFLPLDFDCARGLRWRWRLLSRRLLNFIFALSDLSVSVAVDPPVNLK